MKKIKVALFIVALFVLGLEIFLRAVHEDDPVDRNPKGYPDYRDVGQGGGAFHPGGLLTPNRKLDVFDGYGGTVPWRTNSAGFRSDKEFDKEPGPGVLRILSLGDCHSVGYRVGQGKSFPDMVGGSCEVLIGHTRCPALTVSYFRKQGHRWNPHVLMLNVSINDIVESYLTLHPEPIGFMDLLEGNELPDKCRARPYGVGFPVGSWDWFRDSSMVLRGLASGTRTEPAYDVAGGPHLMDQNQGLGFFLKEKTDIIEGAWGRFLWSIGEIAEDCRKYGVRLVVVVVPVRFQVRARDWDATMKAYGLKADAFDSRIPNRRILEYCRTKGIPVVDALDRFSQLYGKEDIYLPDGEQHWSERGHAAFARAMEPELGPILKR